ncbi:KdsC family phosphatase [Immundisolibacter sp.]|jgi:3-deoxy-D-manno-octulosonate 8-phosphate phosphatase (KDO 8-P phosphatase)|uniref:KdsC family phosphatase n=1 Tax=Immundisolibacter sp. TaxID=1934948 RepID=UPI001995AC2E|nr:HAD family hydrolase [Immundisolibacter sp.]MBC7161373.1 HAD hydrolase family protein [Immundisolibacter sp.]MEA3220912.1 3-deoxy-D-manno-octulosonate 8-phosphate phosphatase KdsC [Immundisolibacter sp.]
MTSGDNHHAGPDSELRALAARIELVVFDVDGVLTDGRLYLGDNGTEFKAFHVRDGYGFKLLREAGVKLAALSGRRSSAVTRRLDELQVDLYRQGCQHKDRDFLDLLQHLGIDRRATAYLGDDVIDLPAMHLAALPVAVADAHPRVREMARWITTLGGGRGAARELCDLIVDAREAAPAPE